MEIKAHHVLIGAFALAVVVTAFLFVLWVSSFGGDREMAIYDIIFEESVAGLSEGSDVRFNGIKVGAVKEMMLDDKDPARVRVRIEIKDDTPVRTDSIASLQLQGLTGLSYVQISGGTANAKRLMPTDENPIPVIKSEASGLSSLMEAVPDLLEKAQGFVDEENQKRFASILKNLDSVTGTVAAREKEIDQLLANMAVTSSRIERASRDFEEVAASANDFMQDDMPKLRDDMDKTMASMRAFAQSAERITTENEADISRFTRNGLSELEVLIKDSRRFVDNLDQLTDQLRDQPARVLKGETVPEYEGQ